MRLLDLTLATPEENLALDEALLEEAERTVASGPQNVLRIWESPSPLVVVGRASKVRDEVDLEFCQRQGIPVLRRCSGGASIVAGPGCLMYAVVLSLESQPELRMIDQAHQFVLGRLLAAIQPLAPEVRFAGTSDLVLRGDPTNRKFSGNSLRCKRTHLLYHGTLLYDFALPLLGAILKTPPRQPTYRAGRSHLDFVANLPVKADALRTALADAWSAREPMSVWPMEATRELARSKYSQDDWNLRL